LMRGGCPPNPIQVLSEAYRVLKSSGRIYILDVTAEDFLIKRINKRVTDKEKEHVRFHSTREYADIFSNAGLLFIRAKRFWYPIKIHIAEKHPVVQ
jgi:ubiquinone/menaquinone biosynthesis C-methylase UbiE